MYECATEGECGNFCENYGHRKYPRPLLPALARNAQAHTNNRHGGVSRALNWCRPSRFLVRLSALALEHHRSPRHQIIARPPLQPDKRDFKISARLRLDVAWRSSCGQVAVSLTWHALHAGRITMGIRKVHWFRTQSFAKPLACHERSRSTNGPTHQHLGPLVSHWLSIRVLIDRVAWQHGHYNFCTTSIFL